MLSLTKKSLIAIIGVTSAALVGVAGCSSDDSSNPGGGNEGDSGVIGDDGGTPVDGSVPTDGGTDGSAGGTTIKTGSVTFTQNTFAGPIYSNSASAYFYELPSGTDIDCAGFTTVDTPTASNTACTIKVCTVPVTPSDAGVEVDAGDAGPVVAPNSGDITLKTAVQAAGITLTAGSNGTYGTAPMGQAKWWDANDLTGEVKSNGSATSIAAFDDTGLVTPGDVTNPMFNSTAITGVAPGTPAFDRGTPLAITYSGGTANTKLNVRLTTTSTAKRAIINCNFDAANGSQSIPAADLGHLEQAGTAGVTGAYVVQAETVKPTTSSDYNFNVTLVANPHNGTFTNSN